MNFEAQELFEAKSAFDFLACIHCIVSNKRCMLWKYAWFKVVTDKSSMITFRICVSHIEIPLNTWTLIKALDRQKHSMHQNAFTTMLFNRQLATKSVTNKNVVDKSDLTYSNESRELNSGKSWIYKYLLNRWTINKFNMSTTIISYLYQSTTSAANKLTFFEQFQKSI